MNRAEKQAEVEFLTDCFNKTQVAICADYHGLTVAEVTDLRRELHKNGCVGRVVKNTLAKLSAKKVFAQANQAELEKFLKLLEGPCFVVMNFDNPVAPAKVVTEFIKRTKKLSLKGGWLDGSFLDQKGLETLSEMPGKEEILGKLLGLLSAPATRLVRLLHAPATQLARVIDAHRQNLEKKG